MKKEELINKYSKEIKYIEKENHINFEELQDNWLKGKLEPEIDIEMNNIFLLKRFIRDLEKLVNYPKKYNNIL